MINGGKSEFADAAETSCMTRFTQTELQAVADALGDTNDGLTGSEIAHLLAICQIKDADPALTKRHRLFNALAHDQNHRQDRTRILGFIRKAMKPERFSRCPERFEPMRTNLNRALAFTGLAVDASGTLEAVERATTLTEAQRRASELRGDMARRGVHPDVLRFCREELLVDNYFHAVLEAVKSVADKLRSLTGLTDDGATLVDRALSGDRPILAINPLKQETEIERAAGVCKPSPRHFRDV